MLIIAQHHISNPDRFWKTAEEKTKNLPDGLYVHGIYPSKDRRTGTCLWEAENAKKVQDFLDKHVGDSAKNFCYEVNQEQAIGLPEVELHDHL